MKDLSPEARQLLEVARDGDSPTTADRARVHRALAATLATGAVSTSASAAAATKTAIGGAAKSGVGLWLAVGAATGVVTSAIVFVAAPAWKTRSVESPDQTVAHVGTAPAPTTHSTSSSARAGAAATRGEAMAESTRSLAANNPTPDATMPIAAPGPSPATAPAAQGTPHKNKRAPEGSSPDMASRAARLEGADETTANDPTASPAVAAARAAVPSSLGAETALLENARAALGRGDAAGALSLLDEHERDFPRGVLVEERLATRVFALCSLGRRAEAQGVAERLLRHSPSSPLRARVLQSCAGQR